MGIPFFMLRKKESFRKNFAISCGLEYGKDVLEMQEGAVDHNDCVLLVDDGSTRARTRGATLIKSVVENCRTRNSD